MLVDVQQIFPVLSCLLVSVLSKDCFWNSPYIYKNFSSKTPYNCVRGDMRDSIVKIKDCEPISVWGLIRHGKRSPGVDFGYKMKDATVIRDYIVSSYKKGTGFLCAQDVENLKNWQDDQNLLGQTHSLTHEGRQEMFGIGKRLKEAFSALLSNLGIGSYKIRPAYGQWVEEGVDGFIKGLSNQPLIVEPANPQYDIMAPYESCPKYLTEVKNNPNTYSEATKYQESPEYIAVSIYNISVVSLFGWYKCVTIHRSNKNIKHPYEMVLFFTKQRIQKRTGIEYDLTNTNITSLYDLCRYTWSGTNNKPSPWCALFTTEDLEVLEYYGDLRHYYRNGHGTPNNEIFGRIPLADLYRTFENAKAGGNLKMTVYFTHATMMDMVYSALEWFKDEVPLTSVYRNPSRKWRSSKLGAFAGNLIVVLHRCIDGSSSEEYKVSYYINEEPVTSVCNEGTCSWQEFKSTLKPFLNTSLNFC